MHLCMQGVNFDSNMSVRVGGNFTRSGHEGGVDVSEGRVWRTVMLNQTSKMLMEVKFRSQSIAIKRSVNGQSTVR